MSGKTGGGALNKRVTFSEPGTASDGGGGVMAAFADRFTVWGKVIDMRGGEEMLAGRLAGTTVAVIRVRKSSDTSTVTVAWRATVVGVAWNIRSIIALDGGAYLDFTCESGVAA